MAEKNLIKRSIEIDGHQTSITLEAEFWAALKEIAAARKLSLPLLVAEQDRVRATLSTNPNLSSHLRVFVLNSLKGTG